MDTFAIRGGKKVVTKESPHTVRPPQSLDDELDELKVVRNKMLSNTYEETLDNQFQALFLDYLDNKVRYSVITPGFIETIWGLVSILDIGEGDEVICSPFADYSLYDAIERSGATVIVHDCDKETGKVLPEHILQCLTDSTKMIFVTHHWGNPISIKKIREGIQDMTPLIIEDCSYAYGSIIDGVHSGTDGDAGIFPLSYEKLIFTGQGSLVVTNNRLLIDCMKEHYTSGYQSYSSGSNKILNKKYLLSPLHAIMGKYSLRHVLHLRHGSEQCLEYFRERMKMVSFCSFVSSDKFGKRQGSRHGFVLQYNKQQLRKLPIHGLVALLKAEGVEIEVMQDTVIECLLDKGLYTEHHAAKISKTLLVLPSFYDWYTHKDIIDQYIAAFRKVQLNLFC